MTENQTDRNYEKNIRRDTRKSSHSPKNLENRTEICLGYYTKYKEICKECKNPYNKYCPFYI